jgi:uncharacterized protein YhfF
MTGEEEELRPMELGYEGTELRRRLVELVLSGVKTATAGLVEDYDEDDPVPVVGERFELLDVDGYPVGIVETTEIRILPAREIDEQFAHDEGEGFESVADWRAAHERFWADRGFDDDTPVVAERFRLLERYE